jgi:two-component system chemotaxis sensor kinase CheA
MQDIIRDFVVETIESLEALDAGLLRLEKEPGNEELLTKVYRLLHTIKGSCGFLGLARLERLAHAGEALIDRLRSGVAREGDEVKLLLALIDRIKAVVVALDAGGGEPQGQDSALIGSVGSQTQSGGDAGPAVANAAPSGQPPTSGATPGDAERAILRQHVRVPVDRLDALMTLTSELVLVRNQLAQPDRQTNDDHRKLAVQRLSHVTSDLQDAVMRARMQSVANAWARMARLVHDLAAELERDIRLDVQGGETELDRQVLDVMRDCLVHLIRNAAVHGIEPPAERLASGKPAEGTIRLTARHEGGHIVCEVADDGRGLDLQRVRRRALAHGAVTVEAMTAMSEAEAARIIFMPGMTTAGEVSLLAGRGMGLDAVRDALHGIGGMLDVVNRPGQGLTVQMRLPLTLAVAAVLIVEAGGIRHALPQGVVKELVRLQPGSGIHIDDLAGKPTLKLRDRLVPVIDLGDLMGAAAGSGDRGIVVVCEVGRRLFGLVVDAVQQVADVVQKPVPARLRSIPVYSGTTILGDGTVILILEPTGLAQLAGATAEDCAPATEAKAPERRGERLLIFRSGGQERLVPLALVAWLDEVPATAIETVDGHHLLQRGGVPLPLLAGDSMAECRVDGLQPMLVLEEAGRRVGVMVDEIIDVVEAPLDIQPGPERAGYAGLATVGGRSMPVMDVGYFLMQGLPAVAGSEVLLVEPSAFCRKMLQTALEGAGLTVRAADTLEAIRGALRQGGIGQAVIDLDAADWIDKASAMAGVLPDGSMVGVAARGGAGLIGRARQAGIGAVVATFDRRGLLAALAAAAERQGAAA